VDSIKVASVYRTVLGWCVMCLVYVSPSLSLSLSLSLCHESHICLTTKQCCLIAEGEIMTLLMSWSDRDNSHHPYFGWLFDRVDIIKPVSNVRLYMCGHSQKVFWYQWNLARR